MTAEPTAHLQRCLVLHRRDYSNTSLLVEVLSTAHGRFPAIAKGARRGRAPTAVLLQPFQPLWLTWSGRGEVRTIGRVEPAGPAFQLTGDHLYCGFYLNELLMRLLARHDPHEDLFAYYHSAVHDLAQGKDIDTVLRRFELRLLAVLGYGLVLDREADTGRSVTTDGRYRFEPERGLLAAIDGVSEGTVGGATLLRLASEQALEGSQTREARRLLRMALALHLGGKPLQSRDLFRRSRRP